MLIIFGQISDNKPLLLDYLYSRNWNFKCNFSDIILASFEKQLGQTPTPLWPD